MSAPEPSTGVVHAPEDGDGTRIDVRLVVAPAAGVFHPAQVGDVTAEGEIVRAGDLLGHVEGPGARRAVASFCSGFVVRVLAAEGERVRAGQPLAWLHPFDLGGVPS